MPEIAERLYGPDGALMLAAWGAVASVLVVGLVAAVLRALGTGGER